MAHALFVCVSVLCVQGSLSTWQTVSLNVSLSVLCLINKALVLTGISDKS